MKKLTVHTDGGARGNPGHAAIGVVIVDDQGRECYSYGECIGIQTNNVAEYSALIHALTWVNASKLSLSPTLVECFLDSMLVVEQMNGKWKVKQPHIVPLVVKVKDLCASIGCLVTFSYVPRAQNSQADALVNQALDAKM